MRRHTHTRWLNVIFCYIDQMAVQSVKLDDLHVLHILGCNRLTPSSFLTALRLQYKPWYKATRDNLLSTANLNLSGHKTKQLYTQ